MAAEGWHIWLVYQETWPLAYRRREVRRSFKLIATQTLVADQTRCFGGHLFWNNGAVYGLRSPQHGRRTGSSRVLDAGQNPRSRDSTEQYPDMNCEALNTERTRLVAERADLKSPLLSSKTEAERELPRLPR